jgi:hypothetical protein
MKSENLKWVLIMAAVFSSAAVAWFLMQDDKQRLHALIPEEATVIIKPDFKNLTGIISQDGLDKLGSQKSKSNSMADFIRMLLSKKEKSGIGVEHDFYISLQDGATDPVMMFYFELAHAEDFGMNVKQWLKTDVKVQQVDGVEYVLMPNLQIAWNKDFAIFSNTASEQISPLNMLRKKVKGSAGNLYLKHMVGGNNEYSIAMKPGGTALLAAWAVSYSNSLVVATVKSVFSADPYGRIGTIDFTTGRARLHLKSINKPADGLKIFQPKNTSNTNKAAALPNGVLFYAKLALNPAVLSQTGSELSEISGLIGNLDGNAEVVLNDGVTQSFLAEFGMKQSSPLVPIFIQGLLSGLNQSLNNRPFLAGQALKFAETGNKYRIFTEPGSGKPVPVFPVQSPESPLFMFVNVSEIAALGEPELVPPSLRRAGLSLNMGMSDDDLTTELNFAGGNRNSISLIYELMLNTEKEMAEIRHFRKSSKDTTIYIPTLENSEY